MRRRRQSVVDAIGLLDPDRDPCVDPRPGDRVESTVYPGEVAEVTEAPIRHGDPQLGPEPGVCARVDSRAGNRHHSTMSLETWRLSYAGGKVLRRAGLGPATVGF